MTEKTIENLQKQKKNGKNAIWSKFNIIYPHYFENNGLGVEIFKEYVTQYYININMNNIKCTYNK